MRCARAGFFCAVGLAAGLLSASVQAADDMTEAEAADVLLSPPRQSLPVGERLEFHGRWFGIPIGRGWIELKAPVDLNGRRAYPIEASGRTNEVFSALYPVQDTLRSYLDAETLRPLQIEKSQREGNYRAEELVTFDYTRHLATYHSLINERSVKEIVIPDDVQDLLTVLYWVRRQPLHVDQPIVAPIYSDEKVYQTRVEPLKTLQLELRRRGTFPCVLIEPRAAFKGVFVRRGRVRVYFTADERRIPLFIDIATPWGPVSGVIEAASLRAAASR